MNTANSHRSLVYQDLPNKEKAVKLTFEDLEFEVNVVLSKEEQQKQGMRVTRQKIVKNASGFALPGESLFIMGASGAGKTSLLNMLSDRIGDKNGQTVKGKIMINDTLPCKQDVFGSLAAYVMQDDVLYSSFTPREALTFAARLKLPGTNKEQDERVESLLEELGLLGVAGTEIGSVLQKTISGGERKRTAIGVELITDPSLILLDEPTSGLDSFKALQIVQLLNKQARKGKTVISTIHQPSSEAFRTFDKLILMMDGYIVYQGPCKDSTAHFAKMGMVCPMQTNPADFYMRVLSVNYPKQPSDEARVQEIVKQYQTQIEGHILEDGKALVLPEVDIKVFQKNQASITTQYSMLIKRNRLGVQRNPLHGRVKIGQTVFIALMCLALFFNQGAYSQARSLIAGLFFIAVNQTMMNLMGTILTFQQERPVFLREQANQMYSVSAYYLAKILVETPVLAATPMAFTLIVYFGMGLTITAAQFFIFYAAIFLMAQCAASWGYFVSSIFEKEDMATAIAPIIMMPLMLFGGQFANSKNIQAWISWFQYISPIRYGLEALTVNEYDSRIYNTTMILENILNKRTMVIANAAGMTLQESPTFNSSQWAVIKYPEVNPASISGFDVGIWKCMVILTALTILLRLLSLFFLKVLVSKFQ